MRDISSAPQWVRSSQATKWLWGVVPKGFFYVSSGEHMFSASCIYLVCKYYTGIVKITHGLVCVWRVVEDGTSHYIKSPKGDLG